MTFSNSPYDQNVVQKCRGLRIIINQTTNSHITLGSYFSVASPTFRRLREGHVTVDFREFTEAGVNLPFILKIRSSAIR